MTRTMTSLRYESPAGTLTLVGDGARLTRILFPDQSAPQPAGDPSHLEAAATQLDEYFAAVRSLFDLPLELGGTAFQRRVWAALAGIPYGTTTTYGAIAREMAVGGEPPFEPRAVGSAVGATPIPIIVPCHRVIGASGSLTGYRGGLELKRKLLDFEGSGGDPAAFESGWQSGQLSLA